MFNPLRASRSLPILLAASLLGGAACQEEEKPPAPTVTAISPAMGLMAGGTTVTITGTNMDNAGVSFGANAAASVNGGGASITARTPPGMRGMVDVSVTTEGGTATLPMGFRYLAPVNVGSLDPNTIGTVGNFTVVLRGTGGLHPPVTVDVTQGGTTAASFTAGIGTELAVPVVMSGLSPGTYSVTVTNGDMQTTTLNDALTVSASALPEIETVSPSRGLEQGGNQVRLTGRYFNGATAVGIGGNNVTGFQVGNNGQEVVFSAPAGTRGPATITVTTPSGTGEIAGAYTYTRAVSITGFNPPQVPQGVVSTVAIVGSGMVGPVRVSLTRNNVPVQINVTNTTESAVTVSLPVLEAGDYVATVVNADGESGVSTAPLRVRNGLNLSSVLPSAGFTDEPVQIEVSGQELEGVTDVLVGDRACGSVAVVTSRRVRCSLPAGGMAGAQDVVVRRGTEAEGVLVGAFTYVNPADPGVKVLAVEPSGGRSAGGETVAVLATGLGANNSVTIGGVAATVMGITAGRRLQVGTPARTLGASETSATVPVVLTVNGTSDTLPAGFRYHARPTFTGVTPNKGATVGGDQVTVTGTGFTTEATQVFFDSFQCTDVLVQGPTQLRCRIPRHPLGFAAITVRNEFDQSTATANAFEYVEAVRIVTTDPARFSTAGGAIVEATGSGFRQDQMRITVVEDGTTATNINVINGETMRFTIPGRNSPGLVTLRVEDLGRLGQPFSMGESPAEYIDPTEPDGGAAGGDINRNISVTVVRDDTGARISGAAVFAGPSWNNALAKGTTNARGMVVVARDPLVGPVTLTAAANGYAPTTYWNVNANTVTFRLTPYNPTPPAAPTLATVSGTVLNWNLAGYPQGAEAGRFKRIAVVLPTEPEPGRLPANPGQQFIISEQPCDVTRDGVNNPLTNQFSLQVEVGRTMALMAMVFFYDSVNGACDGMEENEGLLNLTAGGVGLLGPITIAAGTNPNKNISINYPNSLDWSVSLAGAPTLQPTTVYSADGILDAGEMGSFTFYAGTATMPTVGFRGVYPYTGLVFLPENLAALASVASGMPLTGGIPAYSFRGVAGTPMLDEQGQLAGYQAPFTERFARDIVGTGVTLSNWYSLPTGMNPGAGGVLTNRRFQWGTLGRTDGVIVMDVTDAVTSSARWTVIAPAGTTQVTLPTMTGAPVNDSLQTGSLYAWRLQAIKLWDDEGWEFNNHKVEPLNHPRNWEAHVISADVSFAF